MNNLSKLKKNIVEKHNKDQSQLQFIFSKYKKIIIEAPAGSGKTKTLISKIFYLLASNQLPLNKKILTLTFGLNAAYKIKSDLNDELIQNDIPSELNKVVVTNFHGLSRKILYLYGYLINPLLSDIFSFDFEDDSDVEKIINNNLEISEDVAQWISDFSKKIKNNLINHDTHPSEFKKYLEYQLKYYIPKNKLTYNGLLVTTYELLKNNERLLGFYQKLFSIIVVDEFQDTNILSWDLLNLLITKNSKLFLLGDPLQRIYGFIGAIENLMNIAKNKYSMKKITLNKNYRYQNNNNLLLLDRNIRLCAASNGIATPEHDANVDLIEFENPDDEVVKLSNYIHRINNTNSKDKTAILTRNSYSVSSLVNHLKTADENVFYALFSEDDSSYIDFHYKAYNSLIDYKKENNKDYLTISQIKKWFNEFKQNFNTTSQLEISLFKLLEVLICKVLINKNILITEKDKYLEDSLLMRSLKNNMQYLDEKVIISTIHGAKGLEWENIIIVGMNGYSFPSYHGLCNNCYNYRKNNNNLCSINFEKSKTDKEFINKFLEELSVFYVGATRCRKNVIFTTNKLRKNYQGEILPAKISCLLAINGINFNIKSDFDNLGIAN